MERQADLEAPPAWQKNIKMVAVRFAMETERAYAKTLQMGQNCLPLPATPSAESMNFLVDVCFDHLVGCVAVMAGKTMGLSQKVEEDVVERIRRKFQAMRLVMENSKSGLVLPNGRQ